MKLRYEIRDRQAPGERGMRSTELARAKRELAKAFPADRWFIYDRLTRDEVSEEETVTTEETTTKASPADAGCWIEGSWGQYAVARMVEIAAAHGYEGDKQWGEFSTVARARRVLASMGPADDVTLPGDHEMVDDAADEAEAWLNEHVAPEGYAFGWHDGEFFLQSDEWWEEAY